MTDETELLREEVERLTRELDEVSHQKDQSARFGLVLLDEKAALGRRCEELESHYEVAQNELDILREALRKVETSQRLSATTGIEQEDSLLQESAQKEASLTSSLQELEKELKSVRQELGRVTAERDRVLADSVEIKESYSKSDWERKNLRSELKDVKLREQRLLCDNNELEEENIGLQKQVSVLKQSQVEFEVFKHEARRLAEEVESLQGQTEELHTLKGLAEKQLEEALEALQSEREQKYTLKKELDQREQAAAHSGNLAGLRLDLAEGATDDKIRPSTVGDLFSELHLTEIRKLEKQLETIELEKESLAKTLDDAKLELEQSRSELEEKQSKLLSFGQRIDAIVMQAENEANAKSAGLLSTLKRVQNDLSSSDGAASTEGGENVLFKDQVANLMNKISTYEQQISDLDEDLKILENIGDTFLTNIVSALEDIASVQEDVAQLYHHVCTLNGQTPNRVVLDHAKGEQKEGHKSRVEVLADNLQTNNCRQLAFKRVDPSQVKAQVETLKDQVKFLKEAVESALGNPHKLIGAGGVNSGSTSLEEGDPQEQIIKLKSLLSTKREQIATLRAVLKANKQTAEVALANLKSKYETEKAIVSETMQKLRHELKSLKEDAATFASLRAMFAARCEEYVAQLDELQRQLGAAEEEKKTLNSLLRMAIQQKLALTQRLEDLEMDRERSHLRRSGSATASPRVARSTPRGSPHHSSLPFFNNQRQQPRQSGDF
ncbi:protein bicaudal D-like [Varroa jacobsoni]|nr:protein bicaudal D-like isoform X2 [Varroa destructor]XP_022657681.1 protein bicaudal D-like isoform X2 [Varroa destructor]XP_022657682.1 protein bicaudal D-like isoform X2 [Varroa destructor]XP_022657683.1 protein bicaudal D-like isoform X2 [Varroa destructor]XP_022686876.1 protein bicaudal D-like [Varroa jacobsoni]XP_022686877.1 protein bicaudal D-like [Varroa jacobsoni]XP_022686878.1 protein bicaudal D-like [Varroa jacobsoni]